jgi:hypothetical protein
VTVLKKKYESDEEEKVPEVSTTVPIPVELSADDAIMPPGYIDAYNKVLAQITDEEEKSKTYAAQILYRVLLTRTAEVAESYARESYR